MKIDTALILCAGLGKRLNPLTLTKPKPLLEIDNMTILERCINMIIKFGAKRIFLNTFYLRDQIFEFIKSKKFCIDIRIIEDGKKILNTGGGILNMIENSKDNDFIIFNPDTVWHEDYIVEIKKMQNYYFSNRLNNILLVVNKELSFDKKLTGDFSLMNNLLKKKDNNNFIYTGCQILNRNLFEKYKVHNFSISEIWKELFEKEKLNGFESYNKFNHLTDLEIFNKL